MEIKLAALIPSLAAPTRCLKYLRDQIVALRRVIPDLPVIILAQEWEENGWSLDEPNVYIHHAPKRGITPARKALRELALASEYNYFLMTDDDVLWGLTCGLPLNFGTLLECGRRIMDLLSTHPDGFGGVQPCFLKGFFVSRFILEQVQFPDLDATGATDCKPGFEDFSFVAECIIRFPTKRFSLLDTGLRDLTPGNRENTESTWWTALAKSNPLLINEMYFNTLNYLAQFENFKWLCDSDIMLKGSPYSCSIAYDFLNNHSLEAMRKYYFTEEEVKK